MKTKSDNSGDGRCANLHELRESTVRWLAQCCWELRSQVNRLESRNSDLQRQVRSLQRSISAKSAAEMTAKAKAEEASRDITHVGSPNHAAAHAGGE